MRIRKFDWLLLLLVFVVAIAVINRDNIKDFRNELKEKKAAKEVVQMQEVVSNPIDVANVMFTMDDATISVNLGKVDFTKETEREITVKTSVDASLITCNRGFSEEGNSYLTFLYKKQECTMTIAKQQEKDNFVTVILTFAGEKPVKTKITSKQNVGIEVFGVNTYACTITN